MAKLSANEQLLAFKKCTEFMELYKREPESLEELKEFMYLEGWEVKEYSNTVINHNVKPSFIFLSGFIFGLGFALADTFVYMLVDSFRETVG